MNNSDSIHVLYIEDSPANLALLQVYFNIQENMELSAAMTAEEGIELAKKLLPDLVLMDINLPGMDGTQAMKRLREIPETKHIPIIAVSADAIPERIEAALEAGFSAYLTKPFQLDTMMEHIRHHLAEARKGSKIH